MTRKIKHFCMLVKWTKKTYIFWDREKETFM